MIKAVVGVFLSICVVVALWGPAVVLAQTPSVEGARLYFIEPADGSEIEGPVKVSFGLSGMGVAPAGVEKAKTGHHHMLVDATLEDFTDTIPKDDNHVHFGGGQTETVISLPPGKHTLQLILGDHNHIPHVPPVTSDVITIYVK